MNCGLSEIDLAEIQTILASIPSIERAVLFGSRAIGHARYNSDIDIMLFGDEIKYQDIDHMHSLLEETALPYQFDILRHNSVKNRALLVHVEKDGKTIFDRYENI